MSRRNNMERLGASSNANSPTTKAGFDFNFVSPTTHVELPSKGQFYAKNHPLHGEETVEVREMTAYEEDILADARLQKSGTSIDKLIQSIIVNKRINANSLLIGDKNAITIAARMGGYGALYKTEVSCPACSAKNQHEFDLRGLDFKQSVMAEDVSHVEGRIFQLTLPRTEYNVQIKLLNAQEMAKFNKPLQRARKNQSNTNLQTNLLKLMIHSIENKPDGVWYEDKSVVEQFVKQIPAVDSLYVRSVYSELSPDIDMTQEFECTECGHLQKMEVPLNADFFWPNS